MELEWFLLMDFDVPTDELPMECVVDNVRQGRWFAVVATNVVFCGLYSVAIHWVSESIRQAVRTSGALYYSRQASIMYARIL